MTNQPYNDDTLMPFGVHQGKRLEDVPAWYLLYIYDKKPNLDKRMREYIEDNMDVLQKEVNENRNG